MLVPADLHTAQSECAKKILRYLDITAVPTTTHELPRRPQNDAYLAPIAPPQRRKPQRLFKSVGALHKALSGPKVAPAFTDYGAPYIGRLFGSTDLASSPSSANLLRSRPRSLPGFLRSAV